MGHSTVMLSTTKQLGDHCDRPQGDSVGADKSAMCAINRHLLVRQVSFGALRAGHPQGMPLHVTRSNQD
jgi:hypothetical protein